MINLILPLICLQVTQIKAAEWFTSRGYYCTERCQVGVKTEIEKEVYWCPAVDGVSTLHTPVGRGESGRPGAHGEAEPVSEDYKELWDYCSPAVVESLQGEEEHHYQEAVNLPARVNRTKRQSGGGGFNPGNSVGGNKKVLSALPDIYCDGECKENIGGRYNCDIPGDQPNNFFCSPEVPLERNQISSRNKLWCMGPCNKQLGEDFYTCKTLYGFDHCSPASDRSYKGSLCTSSCQPQENSAGNVHYQCSTAEGGNSDSSDGVNFKENCGSWDVEEGKKKALEYTVDDEVCAGPCLKKEGSLVCEYVAWEWDEDQQAAHLVLALGSCDPDQGWCWTTIGLIIGGILGGIAIIGLVAFFVSKNQYQKASTIDD